MGKSPIFWMIAKLFEENVTDPKCVDNEEIRDPFRVRIDRKYENSRKGPPHEHFWGPFSRSIEGKCGNLRENPPQAKICGLHFRGRLEGNEKQNVEKPAAGEIFWDHLEVICGKMWKFKGKSSASSALDMLHSRSALWIRRLAMGR